MHRKWLASRGCGAFEQAGFAELLATGGFDRHMRRTRLIYRGRRDALLSAVARYLPNWRPIGTDAGLHIVLRLPDGSDDTAVAARAETQRLRVAPLSNYTHRTPVFPALVLGFAGAFTRSHRRGRRLARRRRRTLTRCR